MKKRLMQPRRDKGDQQRGDVRRSAIEKEAPEPQEIEREVGRHRIGGHGGKQYLPRSCIEQHRNDRRFPIARPH